MPAEVTDPGPLLEAASISLPPGAELTLTGCDPVLGARHHAGEAAASAAGAAAAWAARVGELRGLPTQRVVVDVTAAATSLLGFVFQSVDGELDVDRVFSPVTAIYETGDGRRIHLHGGLPHLAKGTTELLGCDEDPAAITRAVADWDATDLEDALAEAGLCGAIVRTSEEWAAHPHGRLLVDRPAIRTTRLGDAPRWEPMVADRPLGGLRVLDLTRILAGPTVGRTLAAHGAEVLRVDGPGLATIEPFAVDTGRGKRRALCDLDVQADRSRLLDLVDDADVVVLGYRPGALDARGLGATDLATRRPGIVVVQVSCYGLDRKVNRFFRRSPIAAVAPTVAWAGGDDRVVRTSDSAVAITATGQMNGYVVDKTMVRIEHGADFAMWRMRSLTATGPLGVKQGGAGVAVAYFEQEVRLRPINTIPHEIWKLLHGQRIDLEALREFIKTPVSDPPGGSLGGPLLAMALAGLNKRELTALRDRLRHLHERTAGALDITERVLRG